MRWGVGRGGVFVRGALLAVALSLCPLAAAAQDSPRERFSRGVALAAEGDWRTALIEFRAAYQGTQNPEVLFNVAAAHEHLGEYVEALEALERYQRLAPPEAVARHREEVVSGIGRLVQRIGTLRVVTPTPSARCAVDGAARPIDDLRAGLRVSAGRRAVRCEAAGYEAREVTVDVAPNAVSEALVEMVRARATLVVTADRPGAEVRVDGRAVGRTPLAEALVVDEGAHRVEVSLPGYDPVVRDVDARVGGAPVEAALRWSDPVPADVAARLVVRASEPGAVATLDGRPVPTDGSRALPPGPHRLRVERDDHLAVERDVVLPAGGRAVEDVALSPTPAYRAAYLAHARRQRRTWQVVGGTGVVLAVAGAVLLGAGLPPALDADARAVAADEQFQSCRASGGCGPEATQSYASQRDNAAAERDAALPLAIAGGVLAGVGLAGAIVGAVLWGEAEPVDRFERPPVFRVGVAPSGVSLGATF